MNADIVFVLIVGVAIGFALGRGRSGVHLIQNDGETRLARAIRRNFSPPDFHLMNHITLRLEDGTTQVDHILVSRFGVFVIECKDYKGWIFANARHATWTQVLFRWKFRFQNPIHQNFRHVRAVQGLLDFLPPESIRSAVVFTGEAEFKTEIPNGVFDIPGFLRHIREQSSEVMSLNRMHFCVGRLEAVRLSITGATDVEHVQSLRRRHGR
ncbi:nuclease-related domain-containing protein [Uliginosibacterium sp. H1]|uniref:nuclease-related domain-containing protein n=1 Tax=Uliginosibacterium sp. H1 TaxID=3114757 RepID=UPI002E19D44E|nr:nuclease-related domain-containing protein [Uliginosibacterium sp. H1]